GLLAQKAMALTRQLNEQEGSSVQTQLKNHLTEATARLTSAETELLTYQQRAQVELLKEDTQAMLDERGDPLRLIVAIESEKARLQSAEQEIKNQERVLPVGRAVGVEEALQRAIQKEDAQQSAAQKEAAQQHVAQRKADEEERQRAAKAAKK